MYFSYMGERSWRICRRKIRLLLARQSLSFDVLDLKAREILEGTDFGFDHGISGKLPGGWKKRVVPGRI